MRAFLPILSPVALVLAQPAIAEEVLSQVEVSDFDAVVPQDFSIDQVQIIRLQPVELHYVTLCVPLRQGSKKLEWLFLPAQGVTEESYAVLELGDASARYGFVEVETLSLVPTRRRGAEFGGLRKRTVLGLQLSRSFGPDTVW